MVFMPVCVNKVRNGSARAEQGHSQPAKAATMCMVLLEYAHPPPPNALFASTKPFFKTHCTD